VKLILVWFRLFVSCTNALTDRWWLCDRAISPLQQRLDSCDPADGRVSPIPSIRCRDPAYKLQTFCSPVSDAVPPSSSDPIIRHHTLPAAGRQQSSFLPIGVSTSISGPSSGSRRVPRASYNVGHHSTSTGPAVRARRHYSVGNNGGPSSGTGVGRRNRVMAALIEQVRAIERRIPSVNDVSKIDKYSRVIFPSLFVVFNSCYWSFYLLQAQWRYGGRTTWVVFAVEHAAVSMAIWRSQSRETRNTPIFRKRLTFCSWWFLPVRLTRYFP